jgi:uncharacterized protein YecE (DUF72 family)
MEKRPVTYRVGIGGWEHEALDQCFYPRLRAASLEKLRYYARFFDAVEVRSTFWDESLRAEDARQWVDAVAPNKAFLFAIKLHASFTHKRHVKPQVTKNVRSVLVELNRCDRLGALLVQFPYTFTNTSANRFHIVKLSEIFSGFPMHVEFRHETWNQPSLMSFLAENGLRPVSADLPRIRQYMPFITGQLGESAYLRLHGRNEKGWLLNGMDTRYDYLYNSKELRELVRRLQALSVKCNDITVICNNTTNGKAIANAFQLMSALSGGKSLPVPEAALAAFPHLGQVSCSIDPDRLGLADEEYRKAI